MGWKMHSENWVFWVEKIVSQQPEKCRVKCPESASRSSEIRFHMPETLSNSSKIPAKIVQELLVDRQVLRLQMMEMLSKSSGQNCRKAASSLSNSHLKMPETQPNLSKKTIKLSKTCFQILSDGGLLPCFSWTWVGNAIYLRHLIVIEINSNLNLFLFDS